MKTNYFLSLLFFISLTNFAFAQEQSYVEVNGTATDTIEANKIEILITLTEEPSKGKVSLDEQQSNLQKAFTEAGVDIKKQVNMVNQSQATAKRTNVYQYKSFLLTVESVEALNSAFTALDNYKIPEVRISRYYNDKADQVIMELKAQAVLDAQRSAQNLAQALGQSVGKAIRITDFSNGARLMYDSPIMLRSATNNSDGGTGSELMGVELKPIVLNQSVTVRFLLD